MKTWFVPALFVALAAGCATTKQDKVEESRPLWPSPPDPTRIEYLRAYHGPSDVAPDKSWLDSIVETLVGGGEPVLFKRPVALHVDKDGRIFVSEFGLQGFYMLDPNKNEYAVWGRVGPLTVKNPVKITSDPQGNIYVAEREPPRVIKYSAAGEYLQAYGRTGELQRPTGLAYDAKLRRVLVADIGLHQIVVFNAETGERSSVIGKRGPGDAGFNFPTFVAADRQGGFWVADTMNFRAKHFDAEGNLLKSFGCNSTSIGCFARMKGIALDSEDHVYVTDSAFNVVQIFDAEGRLLLFFGGPGKGPGQLQLPTDMDIAADDKIYVLDKYNRRINVYRYVKQPDAATSQPAVVEQVTTVESAPASEPASLPAAEAESGTESAGE